MKKSFKKESILRVLLGPSSVSCRGGGGRLGARKEGKEREERKRKEEKVNRVPSLLPVSPWVSLAFYEPGLLLREGRKEEGV